MKDRAEDIVMTMMLVFLGLIVLFAVFLMVSFVTETLGWTDVYANWGDCS